MTALSKTLQETNYLGYTIEALYLYSDGRCDFISYRKNIDDQARMHSRCSLYDVKEEINDKLDYPYEDQVSLISKEEKKKAWLIIVGLNLYHTDSFTEALKFSIKYNAVYFESKDHHNSEYL